MRLLEFLLAAWLFVTLPYTTAWDLLVHGGRDTVGGPGGLGGLAIIAFALVSFAAQVIVALAILLLVLGWPTLSPLLQSL